MTLRRTCKGMLCRGTTVRFSIPCIVVMRDPSAAKMRDDSAGLKRRSLFRNRGRESICEHAEAASAKAQTAARPRRELVRIAFQCIEQVVNGQLAALPSAHADGGRSTWPRDTLGQRRSRGGARAA